MKSLKLLIALAVCAAGNLAQADVYGDFAATSRFASAQEEVIIGEQAVPAPAMEYYGPVPAWSGGCCERVPSHAGRLWGNYCWQKHHHVKGACCGKTFCGHGPFARGCCHTKGVHVPRPGLWGRCHRAKCCTGGHLPRFGLFNRCCAPKGGKGKGIGVPVINGTAGEVPVPVIEGDFPPAPPMFDQAT